MYVGFLLGLVSACAACLIRETNGLKYGSWKKEVAQHIHTTSNQVQASNEQIIAVIARILIVIVKNISNASNSINGE